MKFIYKFLIVFFIVTIVVLGISYDIQKSRTPVESFQDFQTTIITNLTPKEGDSSTIVTIEGKGLNHIEEVLFNGIECVILENRTPIKLQIIPPALTELGFTIEQIRKKIDKEGFGEPVSIKLLKKNGGKDIENAVELQDINFIYIDKGANWKNQCPKEEVVEEEVQLLEGPSFSLENLTDSEAKFKEGTDLYFLHVTLPEMETKIKNLETKISNKIKEQEELYNSNSEATKQLKLIQSQDALLRYKQDMNILRYNIHKKMSDDYNYNF